MSSRSRKRRGQRSKQRAHNSATGNGRVERVEVQPAAAAPIEEPQPIVVHQAELHGDLGSPDVAPAAAPIIHEPSAQQVLHGAAAREHTDNDHHIVSAAAAPPPVAAPPASAQERAYSIDALRGLFLILMTLGFTIQAGMFPEWMYHRQTPPGADPFVDIPGIAWRDLAYAAFLFTMAAALPITLSRRIEKGELELGIMGSVVRRGFMLMVFALMIGHANTYFIGYTNTGRAIAVLGFVLMFALFVRRRSDWNEQRFNVMRKLAWVAAIAFLALTPVLYNSTFDPARADGVIAAIAFAAVVGSVVWYLTRNNLNARLGVLAGAVALYLGARGDGWLNSIWWSSPFPWLAKPSSLTLLCIVIPGTIAGDQVLRWMRAPHPDEPDVKGWSSGRVLLISALAAVLTPIAVVGLYNRWVLGTTQLTAGLCLAGLLLVHRATYPGERMLKSLFTWAAAWLMLGLLIEPFEGGIKKVPETLSYFFTVTGLTTMLLVTFAGVVDVMKKAGWARPFIDVGHNPMLCYILFTVFLNSIFEMIPALRPVLRGSPGASLLRSVLTVVLVVLIVRAFSRARIYWRT